MLNTIIQLLLTSFYATIVSIVQIFNLIRYGRMYFSVKRRDQPPALLTDSDLGTHDLATLASGIKIHYVSAGDRNKPLVLFLHGFPECWFSWRHQIRDLKKDYWVVACDLRGYGDSDKPNGKENYKSQLIVEDVKQLIEHLGRNSVILVAHDWGGFIGYVFTALYPDQVDKLIILNAPHHVHFREVLESSWRQFFKSWYIYFFQIPFLPELVLLSNDLMIFDKAFRSADKKDNLSSDEIECYKYYFSKKNAMTAPLNYYRENMGATRSKQGSKYPVRITKPTLVIWGNKDMALETSLATGCSKYIDTFTVKIVENGSHFVQMDKPDDVNRYIREFLES